MLFFFSGTIVIDTGKYQKDRFCLYQANLLVRNNCGEKMYQYGIKEEMINFVLSCLLNKMQESHFHNMLTKDK